CVLGIGFVSACTDRQPIIPRAAPGPLHPDIGLLTDASGTEYESDTGAYACPAVLMSNVHYYIRIAGIGDRGFWFYAPHARIGYVGGGVYRYRMNIGTSDDGRWMAEGSWLGKCVGYGQWGIGKVTKFEGTIWQVGDHDNLACGGAGGGGGDADNPLTGDNTTGFYGDVSSTSYDPLDPYGESTTGCPSSGGGSGTGPGGTTCHSEYAYLDELVNGEWVQVWEGYVTVCE
ncbi:MAG TPA: hypothetical protein VFH27_10430, partial [Longimicrobiaceae bacterium]|nr:hypothetical protein [Longimicrobiaceae bacterium]